MEKWYWTSKHSEILTFPTDSAWPPLFAVWIHFCSLGCTSWEHLWITSTIRGAFEILQYNTINLTLLIACSCWCQLEILQTWYLYANGRIFSHINYEHLFQGFNKEMDEIFRLQKAFAIPDPELRQCLRDDNLNFILPFYSAFLKRYQSTSFTKNPDKYIKYKEADVRKFIVGFFDAAAWSVTLKTEFLNYSCLNWSKT